MTTTSKTVQNAEIKALLKEKGITYERLAKLTGYSVGSIKWRMNNPLNPDSEKRIRKAIEDFRGRRILPETCPQPESKPVYTRNNPSRRSIVWEMRIKGLLATKAHKMELDELCKDIMDLDPVYREMIREIQNNMADSSFSDAECLEYIGYLREIIFNERNKR